MAEGSKYTGLSEAEAARRLRETGPNQVSRGRRVSLVRIFAGQFGDYMTLILIGCAGISAVLGEGREALAMLGLITMVTPILYRKAAERTTELQDINVATQMRMMSSAVDDYIKDNYNEVGEAYSGDMFELTDADMEKLEKYLPYGFDTQQTRLFDDFKISVRRRTVQDKNGKDHHIYTTAVLAPLRDDLTMMRSSKIASMIGVNGGVLRRSGTTGPDDTPQYTISGVQGTWEANADDYGFGSVGAKDGSLVVISNEAISSVQGDVNSDEVLYRVDDGGNIDKNTMQTTLYMDGHDVRGLANLIAQGGSGGTITIGKEGEPNNLIVTGYTNLEKELNVSGLATFLSGLTVSGATQLGDTTITGDLTQSGGDVSFTPGDFTVDASGDINMDADKNTIIGGTNVTVKGDQNVNVEAGNVVSVSGGDRVTIASGDNSITVAQGGNTIVGPTTFQDRVTINNDLYITGGNIYVKPPEGEESKVQADWLLANKGVKVAGDDIVLQAGVGATINNGALWVGGDTEDDANLFANNYKVRINKDNFSVGGDLNDGYNKINIKDTEAFFGYAYQGTTSETETERNVGLTVDMRNLVLANYHARLAMTSSDGLVLKSDSTRIKMNNDSIVIGVVGKEENDEIAKIVATSGKVGFENKNDGTDPYSLYLENGELDLNSKNVVVDEYGMAFAGENETIAGKDSVVDNSTTGSILPENSKVAISRKGIIEVAAPTSSDNDGGFIRARRLVSDVKYPTNTGFAAKNLSGTGNASKPYDYFQVNPAYTSVMNDIKLASRGGARLSDILPDFINKGIYIVDNTYDNEYGSGIFNWMGQTASGGKISDHPKDCTDNSCIASPWMGFVPAPLCPPNYAKVITMNPIRWRMSEVYYVVDPAELKDAVLFEGVEKKFNVKLWKQTNPEKALINSERWGIVHTGTGEHSISFNGGGYPMTFQTNTWLNTSVQPNKGDFQGWHAVMGFLYRPGQFDAVMDKLFTEKDWGKEDKVYWNLFPVYGGEMMGVANVYCYFDRGGSVNQNKWGDYVDHYDQINKFKTEKTQDYMDKLNDPELGYNDAW